MADEFEMCPGKRQSSDGYWCITDIVGLWCRLFTQCISQGYMPRAYFSSCMFALLKESRHTKPVRNESSAGLVCGFISNREL